MAGNLAVRPTTLDLAAMSETVRRTQPGAVDLTPPRVEAAVALPDGRRLGMAEYGPPAGRPVLWFHGTPGGRHQIPESLRRALDDLDARVIVVERPGYGDSSHHRYREVLSISDDVAHVVDTLEIDRFAVAALSGGGPYALGVSHALRDRVVGAAILGGVVPHAGPDAHPGGLVATLAPLAGFARVAGRPVGAALGVVVQAMQPVKRPVFRAVSRAFPSGDQAVLGLPEMREMFLHDIARTARGGLPGPLLDLVLFTRDWGFRLSDLAVPVDFWQGDADPIVTREQTEWMASAVPGSTLELRAGESHLGGLAVATEAIERVLDHWPR